MPSRAGTGSSSQIADAHAALDSIEIPPGPLAVRVLAAAGVVDRLRPAPPAPLVVIGHAELLATVIDLLRTAANGPMLGAVASLDIPTLNRFVRLLSDTSPDRNGRVYIPGASPC